MRPLLLTLLLGGAALPASLLLAPAAQAQSALCPTTITVQGGERTGFVLENGACTNRNNAGAFSGAALATQALSDLSQSTTQETNRNTAAAIVDRREVERERSAVTIAPRLPIATPTPTTRARRAEPEVAPELSRPARTRRASVRSEPAPLPRVVRREAAEVTSEPRRPARILRKNVRSEAAPLPKVLRREPEVRPLISKDAPPPVLPLLLVPEGPRFAAWATGFGDYERRTGSGQANIQCCFALGGAPNALILDVRSSATTAGFTGGLDVTGHNLFQAGDGIITGVLTGYITTDLSITTRSTSVTPEKGLVGNGFGQLRANLSGPSLGYFATYFNGPFSADFTYKADLLDLNERFTDSLSFTAQALPGGVAAPELATFSGSGHTSLTAHSLISNVNYRFPISGALWVEPTAGIQYTATNYGRGAASLGLDNGDLFRVQGGLRVGSTFATENDVLVTASLSGLAYSNVLINGGFLQGGGFDQNNILARADEGKVRGLGVLSLAFDYRNGFSWFVQGNVRGGDNLFGAGGRGGLRYQW